MLYIMGHYFGLSDFPTVALLDVVLFSDVRAVRLRTRSKFYKIDTPLCDREINPFFAFFNFKWINNIQTKLIVKSKSERQNQSGEKTYWSAETRVPN